MDEKNKRLLVAMGAPATPQSPPVVIIGISEGAWKEMDGYITQNVDLTKIGIHAQLMVFKGETHDDLIRILRQAAASVSMPTGKLEDLGIEDPTLN